MKFEYLEPASVAEAAAMLGNYRHRAKILAGGTDLVVQIRQGTLKPDFVIHIGRIEELNRITTDSDGGLFIGTLATMRAIERSERLAEHWDILRQGAAQVSCPQVRNVATLGGNSCNGIPSADTVPPLIALSAEAIIVGPTGERRVQMETFHRGPSRTVLEADEFMRGFKIPAPPPCTGGCYLKYTPRGTSELAVVGIAALITLNPKDGTCQDARIVLGACGPTPLRSKKAESLLRGNRLDAPLIEIAAHAAAEESRPNPGISVRAPASYRREMVRVWGRHALMNAWMRAEAYHSS